jgi:hypothetical protein
MIDPTTMMAPGRTVQVPERISPLPELAKMADQLTNRLFWEKFRHDWIQTDALHEHIGVIREMLTLERLVDIDSRSRCMADTEHRWFINRMRRGKDKLVRVYRGSSPRSLMGFSWTTDLQIAKHFAFGADTERPVVVSGLVPLQNIVLRLDERETKECICFPEHIQDVVFGNSDEFPAKLRAAGKEA